MLDFMVLNMWILITFFPSYKEYEKQFYLLPEIIQAYILARYIFILLASVFSIWNLIIKIF